MFLPDDPHPAADSLPARPFAVQKSQALLPDPKMEQNEALKITLHTMMQLEDADCGTIFAADQDEALFWVEACGFSIDCAGYVSQFKEIKEFRLIRRSDRSNPLAGFMEKEGLQGLVVMPITHDGKKLALIALGSHGHGIDRIPLQGQTMMKLVSHLTGQLLARLQMAVSLKDRETRLLSVVAQSFDGIMVADQDYRIVEWNAAQTALTGYSEEEMLGQKVWDYFYRIMPDDYKKTSFLELIQARVCELPEAMTNMLNTFSIQCKDGSRKEMEISWSEVETRGKKLYCAIMRDITQRETAEQNYQMLFREMLDGFALHEIILDDDGKPVNYRFLVVNPAFEKMTGLRAADIIGKTVLEVIPGVEDDWIEIYGRVALTGEPVVFENYSKDIARHFKISAFQPAVRQFACIIEDITERKLAEEALRKSEEHYHLIDEASQDLVYSYDLQGRLTHANSRLCRFMGLRSEEMIGKTNEELGVSPEQRKVWAFRFQQVLQTGQSYTEEAIITQGDDEGYYEIITNPIRDPSGKIIGIAGMTRDITARKKAELQAREQLEELRRWHNVTLGREDRILELKREINDLLEEAGKPPRYASAKEADFE